MKNSIVLRGMTWDHSRGFDPMVATAKQYSQDNPGVEIIWEKRPLQAFADRPIGEMANDYDLMVIDHPHVGEVVGSGELLALDTLGREREMAQLAANSIGPSHRSYEFLGHQWALAIDAATPVAAYRPDMMEGAPTDWLDVVTLAKAGQVAFALIPINALMTFMGMARNFGYGIAENSDCFIKKENGLHILGLMCEITGLMSPRCLTLDPIGILDWMGGTPDAPAYSPFGYGYTNYSRDSYCQFPIRFVDAPGHGGKGPQGTVIGGTGIAVSATSQHCELAADYAFWIAGAVCQSGLFFDAGGQPANAAAWDSDACNAASDNFFHNTRATLNTSWLRPRYDGYMGFQEHAGTAVHSYLSSETTIDTALAQMEKKYQESRE